jgi:hypothetical protein
MTLVRFLMLSSLLLAAACSSLPRDMPADFSVTVSQSGGMLPISSEATYSLAECRFHQRDQTHGQLVETEARFTLPEQTLRTLYQKLIDGHFDNIGTHQEVIYDRGGWQVTVTAAGKTYTVVDGGQTVVDAFWQPSWKAIYDELARLEETARGRAVPLKP